MAVRTAYAPVAGEVLTAANMTKLPGGWIGYAEVTATQATIIASVDLTSLTVTVTVGTSRRIRVTGSGRFLPTVANDGALLTILEGATMLQSSAVSCVSNIASYGVVASVVLTPSAGSHTYKLQGARSSGTGSFTLDAAATAPAFILVEDLGPAA